MRRAFLSLALASMAGVAFAPSADAGAAAPAVETPATAPKSIVPSKYAGKYKNGGSGAVPDFIKSQAYEGNDLVPDSFFSLCTVNGIDADKIAHYKAQVDAKTQGSAGRARMTLGNMLASKARKQGFLLNQAGEQVALDVPKPALGGAAAKAAAAAGTAEPTPTPTPGDDAEQDDDSTE